MKQHRAGTVRDGRIGIYDHKGNCKGTCGPYATEATVSGRFGVKNPVLRTVRGKLEWHGSDVRPTRRPAADRMHALGSVKATGR